MTTASVVLLCPAGFEEVVAEAATRDLPRTTVGACSSGYLRVSTAATASQLRAFGPATNAFSVVATVPRTSLDGELRALSGELADASRPARLPHHGTLRLRVHDDGRFAPASPATTTLENAVATWAGLRVARSGATIEVWVVRRIGEPTVLASKVTAGGSGGPAGQLRPEIASALASIGSAGAAALVLDPFAGSGVLGVACAEAGAERVWVNDVVRVPGRSRDARVRWTHVDFRVLDVAPGSVDAVVTDPPWGAYDGIEESALTALYGDLAASCARWLAPGAPAVVLTGAPRRAVERLTAQPGLVVERTWNVLVNGRKAQLVSLRRAAGE